MPTHNHDSLYRTPSSTPMQPILRPGWRDVLILIFGYVILDWASFIYPLHGLNITPWSPAPALGLLFLMRYGKHAVLPFASAILLADISVRHLPTSLPLAIALAALLTLGYWAIAEVLRRRLPAGGIFEDRQGLFNWAAVAIVGTWGNSLLFVMALSLGGLIPAGGGIEAFVRYWVGDSVGVLVSMPFLWMLLDERGRMHLRGIATSWLFFAYLVAIGAALWVAFGLGAKNDFQYVYVLFLPIAWMAARHGLTGAVCGAALIQIGVIASVQLVGLSAVTVLEIQSLAVVLALFGFFIGVVVDEKQRVSDELSQTLRLAAAGEMAGALAHELNQPLTALSAYGMACESLLEQGDTGEKLRETIRRMVAESFRAADVVRRLRDFFRTGATRLERISLSDLLVTASSSFAGKARQLGVDLQVLPVSPCVLLVDRLQLEVVLRNLIENAFDAVMDQPIGSRRIRVSATSDTSGRVCIDVEDSGPGLSGATAARLFEAFQSSKASGLGLGLAISRAIVEAHGGNLWAEMTDHGLFKVVLPTEGKEIDAI